MAPIEARFLPKELETEYRVYPRNAVGDVKATWTLHLELVDPAGAPDPAQPGAKAAVDSNCDNAGVGLPNNTVVQTMKADGRVDFVYFYWHHPDAVDSIPKGKYHCNHLDMGPRGHQGLITLVIQDEKRECSASYKGTNSTSSNPLNPFPSPADVEASVKKETASTPKCSPLPPPKGVAQK